MLHLQVLAATGERSFYLTPKVLVLGSIPPQKHHNPHPGLCAVLQRASLRWTMLQRTLPIPTGLCAVLQRSSLRWTMLQRTLPMPTTTPPTMRCRPSVSRGGFGDVAGSNRGGFAYVRAEKSAICLRGGSRGMEDVILPFRLEALEGIHI